jgi:hypothetical protein
MPGGHHTRKVISVGRSLAVVIPPHVADAMNVTRGDYLIWDISQPPFGVVSLAPVPPYVTNPKKFSTAPPPPV